MFFYFFFFFCISISTSDFRCWTFNSTDLWPLFIFAAPKKINCFRFVKISRLSFRFFSSAFFRSYKIKKRRQGVYYKQIILIFFFSFSFIEFRRSFFSFHFISLPQDLFILCFVLMMAFVRLRVKMSNYIYVIKMKGKRKILNIYDKIYKCNAYFLYNSITIAIKLWPKHCLN